MSSEDWGPWKTSSKILGSSPWNEGDAGLNGRGQGITRQERTVENGQWKTKLSNVSSFLEVSPGQYFSIFLKVEHYQLWFLLQVTENPTQWIDLKDKEIITYVWRLPGVRLSFTGGGISCSIISSRTQFFHSLYPTNASIIWYHWWSLGGH